MYKFSTQLIEDDYKEYPMDYPIRTNIGDLVDVCNEQQRRLKRAEYRSLTRAERENSDMCRFLLRMDALFAELGVRHLTLGTLIASFVERDREKFFTVTSLRLSNTLSHMMGSTRKAHRQREIFSCPFCTRKRMPLSLDRTLLLGQTCFFTPRQKVQTD
ncbi:hypothetical protein TELCIR_12652 [Teladorsagia circumcincta]|uniref:Uncharacterized protein n=1 Tax=Teladorsagia circumcincta TaxID=45464 RepID=A0A2G9U7J0_TELCI|nr:hypothetical protein TELCIR_12652 [Teladorsagia circumcincta]